MKLSYFRLQFLLLMLFSLLPISTLSGQSNSLHHQDLDTKFIEVQELEADYHTASSTITVSGKIKNVSNSTIRGYATVYLLSAEGQELYSYQEEVNGGDSFSHGSTVEFSATARVGDISKVSSLSIDFTKR